MGFTNRYPALIDALAHADKPSRELDAAIWLACFEPTCARFDVAFHTEQYDNYASRTAIECDLGSIWVDQMEPRLGCYTASLECIVELIERVLPGYLYGVRHPSVWAPHHKWAGRPVWEALIADPLDCDCYSPWSEDHIAADYEDIEEHMESHCTPALALCGAFLRALAAKPADAPEHFSAQARDSE